MKVMELKARKIIEVNESYGARLIEHGMAVLPVHGAPPAVAGGPASREGPAAAPAKPPKDRPKEHRKGDDA